MNRASSFELFVQPAARITREFVFNVAPWIFVWFMVAAPFAWLLVRFGKAKMGRTGIFVWTAIFTGITAGICAGIHGVLAFGEAFGSAVDQHRVTAFVFLTTCFPFAASWLALRKSKDEKKA